MKFVVQEEYELSPAVIGKARPNWSSPFWTYVAFGNGAMTVLCDLDAEYATEPRVFARYMAVLEVGEVQVRDLTNTYKHFLEEDGDFLQAVAYGDSLVLVRNMDKVVCYKNRGLAEPETAEIAGRAFYPPSQSFGDGPIDHITNKLRCPDGIIMGHNGSHVEPSHLMFLELSVEPFGARWVSWPGGKSGSRVTAVAYPYALRDGIVKGGQVLVSSCGDRTTPAWGYNHAAITEVSPDGSPKRHVHYEDYENFPDVKKRGRNTLFASSGRYCAMSAYYKSTDEWKGRERLLDLDSSELIEFSLPRGFTKFRFIDHQGSDFWFAQEDRETQGARIIRCQESN